MSALMLSLCSTPSVIDLGRNGWQPFPAALLSVQVFLKYNIFRVRGAGLIFKLDLLTLMILAVLKVRKQRGSTQELSANALCQMLAVKACATEGRHQCQYSLWCHCTCSSLGVLELYTPGDAGLVWGCMPPPFSLRTCACARHTCQFSLRRIPWWLFAASWLCVSAAVWHFCSPWRKISYFCGQVSRRRDQNKRPSWWNIV